MDDTQQSHSTKSCFTSNGDYFALLSLDGRIRIWETSTGKLLQEFAYNSKKRYFTSLCWKRWEVPRKKRKIRGKNKALKTNNNVSVPSLVFGTKKGSLVSYTCMLGGRLEYDVEYKHEDGHVNAAVSCIVYLENSNLIYTCSDDEFIAEWCDDKHCLNTRWKADEQTVKILCLGPRETTLLSSSGTSVKLWNLHTKQVVQCFDFHQSPISFLKCPLFRHNPDADSDDCYFFSGSAEEHVVKAWKIDSKKSEPTASFAISDVPLFVDAILDQDEEENPFKLCVGCKDGRIHIFTSPVRDESKLPIESSKIVDILEEENSSAPLFINGKLYGKNEFKLILVSGISTKPLFSVLDCEKLDTSSKIFNKSLNSSSMITTNDEKKNDCTNGNCSPSYHKSVLNTNGVTKVNPLRSEDVAKIKSGSFLRNLMQAIQDNDCELVDKLLFSKRSKSLTNSFRNIPNNLVGPLLTSLTDSLQRNPLKSKELIFLLRTIIVMHLEYLVKNKASLSGMSGVYQLLESQEQMYIPLLNLLGKIDTLCSYTSEHMNANGNMHSTGDFVYESDDEMDGLWDLEGGEESESSDETETDEETE